MTPPPRVRHRLIVRDVNRGQILVDAAQGRPRLPVFISEDRHTAEVDYINASVLDRFGVRTVVLRSLSHSEPVAGIVDRVHELELHTRDAPAADLRPIEAVGSVFDDPADRAAVAQWRREAASRADLDDGRDWMRPGWFDAACTWIAEALHAEGLGAAGEIRQLRTWESSCVLAVRCGTLDCYFKAVAQGGVEYAVTRYLAARCPDAVPRVIAANPERHWLLMAACRGRKLEELADVAAWERGAAHYARLQVDCIGRVGELSALGCPTRRLDALARQIATLSGDAAMPRGGAADGLARDEFERLQAAVPDLQRRCAELAACGIPDTLEHGDLWPGNVFVGGDACAIIDWEDVAIAPPFFSLAPLTVGMVNAGLGARDQVERVTHAYLGEFESLAPTDRLRRAARLAAPLCFIEMAARYRREPASVVRLHPWMRDLVPQALRLALRELR